MKSTRCYSELQLIESFEERFRYLDLQGIVGEATFGFDRWLNQQFYRSREWRNTRQLVIMRDDGCDLGIPGHEIHSELLVHHMNPVAPTDISNGAEWILNPEFLITTRKTTHNAIHYGNETQPVKPHVAREPGDTKLW